MKRFVNLLAVLSCSVTLAWAQGVRKDDFIRQANGAALVGALVRVCAATADPTPPCTPTAPIFTDIALTQTLSNPTTTDGTGRYAFYATPGRYRIQVFIGVQLFTEFPDVVLGNDPAGNLVVGGPSPWFDVTNAIYSGGASGSAQNTTGSIDFNLNPTRLTLAAAQDFKNGQGIAVAGAGPLPTITTPVGLAVVPQGATGSTTYSYRVAAIDNKRGITACTVPGTQLSAPCRAFISPPPRLLTTVAQRAQREVRPRKSAALPPS